MKFQLKDRETGQVIKDLSQEDLPSFEIRLDGTIKAWSCAKSIIENKRIKRKFSSGYALVDVTNDYELSVCE